MDDDLDFSNNDLLAQIQAAKQQINERLDEIRKCLQSTVDHVSTLEHRLELDKVQIEAEFESTENAIVRILRERKQELLDQLEREVTESRTDLLKRCDTYQQQIIEAADLQTELLRFETNELTMNPHLDTSTDEKVGEDPSEGSTGVPSAQQSPPSVESVGNDLNEDYVDITEDVLHSESASSNVDDESTQMSNRAKQRLMTEVGIFLSSKIPDALEPAVWFTSHRDRFVEDFAQRTEKFCIVTFSAGSQIRDIQRSIASGFSWVSTRVPNIFTWRKNEETLTELKSIPPPVLVICFNISRNLAEQFVENFTVVNRDSLPSGCVIPIVESNDAVKINRWLNSSVTDFVDEDDQQFRPHLRVCILLYNTADDNAEFINQTCSEYLGKYNLRSVLTIGVCDGAPDGSQSLPEHSCGVMLHENGRVLDGQEELFTQAAQVAFSASTSSE